ncbi:MAG TPA: hypothetical protein VGC32_13445 [Solirubrobacterales bacterium]
MASISAWTEPPTATRKGTSGFSITSATDRATSSEVIGVERSAVSACSAGA